MPEELPSTLQRSDALAQRTFAKAHDSALESYGDEQRAARVAWGAVKHTHEKVGDHWQPKPDGARGPSDEQSAKGGADTSYDTKGGVDANASKAHLYDLAKDAGIDGRSTMSKDELADALQAANDRATAEARRP
ncbi:ChaB family protein [Modestobacter muralis]